jgi:hypothetical protein
VVCGNALRTGFGRPVGIDADDLGIEIRWAWGEGGKVFLVDKTVAIWSPGRGRRH